MPLARVRGGLKAALLQSLEDIDIQLKLTDSVIDKMMLMVDDMSLQWQQLSHLHRRRKHMRCDKTGGGIVGAALDGRSGCRSADEQIRASPEMNRKPPIASLKTTSTIPAAVSDSRLQRMNGTDEELEPEPLGNTARSRTNLEKTIDEHVMSLLKVSAFMQKSEQTFANLNANVHAILSKLNGSFSHR
ncbi:hypothetical protein E3N88_29686 [Mikania micrantha]|uniref:Uncharacterized protein n=1 Tax=Mikania micrantha TaxID=192012 RepID=A0A5N6MJZ5_9ASTR|nr:hypothetical protein E3N88_29686 [Mikania micrantha]